MKLADVNLLVAIAHTMHPHNAAALAWQKQHRITTCPITELGLVRVLMQLGLPADDAMTQLKTMKKHADFVPCDVPGSAIAGKVTGHKQTTDAYLLELARKHKGTLCTFDTGIKGAETVKV